MREDEGSELEARKGEGFFLHHVKPKQVIHLALLDPEVHNHEKEGIPLQRVLKWTGQMASAVAYIHTMAVCHRDIKLPSTRLPEVSS